MIAPARYVRHVTLTTGDSRDSLRGEVSDEALAVCRGLLEKVRATGRATLPASLDPPCLLEGTIHARWARLQVVAQATGRPILEMAIALHSRAGATLWRRLHEETDLPVETSPAQPPPEPWSAAVLLSAISLHPEAAVWLGDMERCLAWALYLMSEGEL